MKVLNAFALSMLEKFPASVKVEQLEFESAVQFAKETELVSFIGHKDTAAIVGKLLGVELPMRRETITVSKGETVLVSQYVGPRLPEGTTELPAGAEIKFLLVTVE
jgi:hypothetical protein